jgi:signal transduction histidine kinase
MLTPILTLPLNAEWDIIAARKRAQKISYLAGLSPSDQARISTAVSDITRNIIANSGHGAVHFAMDELTFPQALVVSVTEVHPRTQNDEDTSSVRRLIAECSVSINAAGSSVTVMRLPLPKTAPLLTSSAIAAFARQLEELPRNVVLSAVQGENKELTSSLKDLQDKQEKLLFRTEELELTHSEMLAINVGLDRKANTLELADLRKDEFLAILSHELRGPLSAVGIAAQLLTPSLPEERHAQITDLISRQVMHMTRLVEDLLDVSRISQGKMVLNKGPVDMRDVVEYALEQHLSSATSKSQQVTTALAPNACIVLGESVRLVQVIGNLLANAIRYTPEGGAIRISLGCDEGVVKLDITDTGIGISSGVLPRLFQLYVQAEPTSARSTSGLGLGLALVRSLLEAHEGSVTATSPGPGLGSVFTVKIPEYVTVL